MNIIYITKKGNIVDNLERFHIYDETKRNNQINDKNRVHQNIIFDMIPTGTRLYMATSHKHKEHSVFKLQAEYLTGMRIATSVNYRRPHILSLTLWCRNFL